LSGLSAGRGRVVYTIGYSGLTLESLVAVLMRLGVELVVDVRRFPRSRVPGFSLPELEKALGEKGFEYRWMGALGALGIRYESRFRCVDSPTFNSYVNYLVFSEEARSALRELAGLASERKTALLCRERDPRFCHRQFIADYLAHLGFTVVHVVGGSTRGHEPTPCYAYLSVGPG
jgi:uncharacterized protein (DUF488 family)